MPACKTTTGCPVEEFVSNDEANRFLSRFLIAKSLYKATGLAEIQLNIFRELGLLDDELFLVELEILYMKSEKLKEESSKANTVQT